MVLLAVAPPAGEVDGVEPAPFLTVVGTGGAVVTVPGRVVAPGSVVAPGVTTEPPPPEPPDPERDGDVVVVVPGTVDVVEPEATVVVVDGAVVVVAFEVHTAYRVSPPAGIVIDWLFEYGVPVPADAVSHRERVKPERVRDAPLLSVTDAPEAAYCVETEPVPPLAL